MHVMHDYSILQVFVNNRINSVSKNRRKTLILECWNDIFIGRIQYYRISYAATKASESWNNFDYKNYNTKRREITSPAPLLSPI